MGEKIGFSLGGFVQFLKILPKREQLKLEKMERMEKSKEEKEKS